MLFGGGVGRGESYVQPGGPEAMAPGAGGAAIVVVLWCWWVGGVGVSRVELGSSRELVSCVG